MRNKIIMQPNITVSEIMHNLLFPVFWFLFLRKEYDSIERDKRSSRMIKRNDARTQRP